MSLFSKDFFEKLINIGANHFTDKTMISRIRIMNFILLIGLVITFINGLISVMLQNYFFAYPTGGSCVVILIALFLIKRGHYITGWHLILAIPPIFITVHPFLTDTIFTAIIYYFVFQTLVFALFDQKHVLYSFFIFYALNAVIFLYFGFDSGLNSTIIKHNFTLSAINLLLGLIFQFFTLWFVQYIRKLQEIEINFNIARFQSIFDNSPIGIIVTSRKKGEPKLINQRAATIFGYDINVFKHKSISSFTHPEDRNVHQSKYQELLDNKRPFFDIEKRYIHASGNVIWCRTAIALIRNEQNQPTHTVAMLQDVTKYKAQESKIYELLQRLRDLNAELEKTVDERTQHLIKANEELIRSNQDLEQFAYAASHDLQEPLRMVGNFVQLLERRYGDKLDESGITYIRFAVEGVTRMSKLIKSLLQYSRVGRKEVELRPVDIQQVIEHKLLDLEQIIQDKNAVIEIKKLPNKVICEPVQVGLVFYNLIVNGLKFNQNKKPRITISGEDLENQWRFSVKDNGIGIEEQYHEKIFDIFKRLNRRDKYTGTGVGLAICKKVVFRHQGNIWFTSILGQGTVFYFTISKELESTK